MPTSYIDAAGRLRDVVVISTAYRDHIPAHQVTDQDLDDIVRNFNDLRQSQALFRVPLTVGYEFDKPEAWVWSLRRQDGLLVADFEQVSPRAAQIIQSGHYSIGAEIYHACPAGLPPLPGKVLRRVGVLPGPILMDDVAEVAPTHIVC